MAKGSAGESALSRALGVLEAFSVDAPFLTLSEVSRRSGQPISTTHRIVNELVDQQLLEAIEGRKYRLGNRLWELGTRTPGALGIREIARPFLLEAHRSIGQHVQLAVQYRTDALILDRISAPDAVVNATVIGGRMPLPHTALGLVLLAHGPDGLLDQVIDRGFDPPTPVAIRTVEQLRDAIELTRRRGYAVADGYIFAGSRGIAVPVVGAHQLVIASLGVVVPNDDAPSRPTATTLLRAAAGIGRTLARAYLPASHPDALPGGQSRYLVRSSESSMRFLSVPRRGRRT